MLLASSLVCGCGSAGSPARRPASPTTTLRSASRATTAAPRPAAQLAGAPLGTAQRLRAGGAALTVTVSRVIDPLRGSGVALPAGARAAGVFVQIVNAGPDVYDSSATGDISLVASAGPVTPVFVPRGVCRTPLQDFDNYITGGEHRAGCVAFAVPDGARIMGVRFSPHASARGSLLWRAA